MTTWKQVDNVATTALSFLLVPFFRVLDEKRLPYCVCGNYEQLPEFTSHDVDIWVKEVGKAETFLFDIARQQGFKAHLVYKTGVGSNNFFHKYMDDGTIKFVRIDLMKQCAWRSVFPLVSTHIIQENLRRFKNFYIPNPPVEASMQLLYPLISNGKVKDKYKKPIFTWRHHPAFVSILKGTLGWKHAGCLVKQIEQKDWNTIDKNVWSFRLSVIKRSIFINANIWRILTCLKAFKRYISKFIRPKGIFVVFLGPDGCGKSTLCERIPRVLQAGFLPDKVKKFYWRPMFLPPIRQLLLNFGIKSRAEEFSADSQPNVNIPPDNVIISTIKFIYYWLDFVVGRMKFYSVWAKGGIVCFDRYYHDFFVYPQRFRLKLPSWILWVFMPFVPRPDLVFYLHARPEVFIARKQEVSPNELDRQLNSYSRLLSSFSKAHRIDASKPLNEVVREVSSIILNFMAQREKRNYESR